MKIKDFQMLRLIKAKLLWPKVGEDNEGKDLEDVKNKTQNSFNIFWTACLQSPKNSCNSKGLFVQKCGSTENNCGLEI